MSKKDQSRFDALFGAIATEPTGATELSEHSKIQTSESLPLAKGKDPSYQRTTVYLPKALHRQLKARAAAEGHEISDIVQELVERWLTESD